MSFKTSMNINLASMEDTTIKPIETDIEQIYDLVAKYTAPSNRHARLATARESINLSNLKTKVKKHMKLIIGISIASLVVLLIIVIATTTSSLKSDYSTFELATLPPESLDSAPLSIEGLKKKLIELAILETKTSSGPRTREDLKFELLASETDVNGLIVVKRRRKLELGSNSAIDSQNLNTTNSIEDEGRKIGRPNNERNSVRGSTSEARTPSRPVASSQSASLQTKPVHKAKCSENSCPPGYSAYKGQCYKVMKSDTPVDFSAAQGLCQKDGAVLAADTSEEVHEHLKKLVKNQLTLNIDSQYRRAFIGLMCQNECENPANWRFADGSTCAGNKFCDWNQNGSTNKWNAVPNSLYGASIAAILDDAPDTSYMHKLQPYPADHTLQFMICQKTADITDHLKPINLKVNERLANVVLSWNRPACEGDIQKYILVLLGGSTSYDTEMMCTKESCTFDLNPEVCNYCIQPNTDYTFSVAGVLSDSTLGPAITVSKKIDVETCPNFETPIHTVSTCRGVSEVVHDGSCDNKITWSKGSMCDAVCENGFGFFDEPAPKYSCDQGGVWAPAGKAPECYEIVPVFSANLQFKITYGRPSIENLQHQFDGLVYKYNDIFCPYPEECGIGDIQIKSALDDAGKKLSEVIVTIDTPVYNITDQSGFIDLVQEAVFTVTEDNAFMTLIDYDNVELVLPIRQKEFKAEPMLCCHQCPTGYAYKLGFCVRCPVGSTSPDCQ